MQGEKPDLPDVDGTPSGPKIVGAYDDVDGTSAFVVADLTRDDAWFAIAVAGAADLEEWR